METKNYMDTKNLIDNLYASDKEINEDIAQFIYATHTYIYHLIESKDHEGWEQRLESKRNDIMKILRVSQDLIYACMHDKRESVPYRIGDLITLCWRLLKVCNDDDKIYRIAAHLIAYYKTAPIMDELKEIDIYG